VVRQKRPSKAADAGFGENGDETIREQQPVTVVIENVPFFDSPHDDVLEEAGYVESRQARHVKTISKTRKKSK